MEAISFSEQATAARRDHFAGSNSGFAGQDVRDVGDVRAAIDCTVATRFIRRTLPTLFYLQSNAMP